MNLLFWLLLGIIAFLLYKKYERALNNIFVKKKKTTNTNRSKNPTLWL
jgi:hypothetical protein